MCPCLLMFVRCLFNVLWINYVTILRFLYLWISLFFLHYLLSLLSCLFSYVFCCSLVLLFSCIIEPFLYYPLLWYSQLNNELREWSLSWRKLVSTLIFVRFLKYSLYLSSFSNSTHCIQLSMFFFFSLSLSLTLFLLPFDYIRDGRKSSLSIGLSVYVCVYVYVKRGSLSLSLSFYDRSIVVVVADFKNMHAMLRNEKIFQTVMMYYTVLWCYVMWSKYVPHSHCRLIMYYMFFVLYAVWIFMFQESQKYHSDTHTHTQQKC